MRKHLPALRLVSAVAASACARHVSGDAEVEQEN